MSHRVVAARSSLASGNLRWACFKFKTFHSHVLQLPACSPYQTLIPRVSRANVTPINTAMNATKPVTHSQRAPRSSESNSPSADGSSPPPAENVTRDSNTLSANRGASDAEITSPPRMQRQKKMRAARQVNQSSISSVIESPPRRTRSRRQQPYGDTID